MVRLKSEYNLLISLKFAMLEEQTMRVLAGWVAKIPIWESKYEFGNSSKQAAIRANRLINRFIELGGTKKELKNKKRLVALFEKKYLELMDADSIIDWLKFSWFPYLLSLYLEHKSTLDSMWDHLFLEDLIANIFSLQRQLNGKNEMEPEDWFVEELNAWLKMTEDEPIEDHAESYHPQFFREIPISARDSRFSYINSQTYQPILKSKEDAVRLFLHGIADTEMHAAEICGRNIFEFPFMPWEFYMDMARQLDDEVRHARLAELRLRDFGGTMGLFPVIEGQYAYRIQKSLLGRLCDMNLYSERLALVRAKNRRQKLIAEGDLKTAELFHQVLFDESVHVRIGYRWVTYLIGNNKTELNSLRKKTEEERKNIPFFLLQRHGAKYLGLSDHYQNTKGVILQ